MARRSPGCAKRVERFRRELEEARATPAAPWSAERIRRLEWSLEWARAELARAVVEEDEHDAAIAA